MGTHPQSMSIHDDKSDKLQTQNHPVRGHKQENKKQENSAKSFPNQFQAGHLWIDLLTVC